MAEILDLYQVFISSLDNKNGAPPKTEDSGEIFILFSGSLVFIAPRNRSFLCCRFLFFFAEYESFNL